MNAELFEIDKNFQTPIEVAKHMVSMIPISAYSILEPTPGLGTIVNILNEKKCFEVRTPTDFFLIDKNQKFDCIVMNPPFSSKSAFMKNAPLNAECRGMKIGYFILKECMNMSEYIIALMPWYTIADSDIRLKHLKDFGLKSITTLPRKTFKYARIQTCIIELQKGYKGDTLFKVLN